MYHKYEKDYFQMSLIHYVKFNLLKVENDKNMKLLLIEF